MPPASSTPRPDRPATSVRPHERQETGIEPALFVLLAAAWGSSYLFIKIGVETLPVFSLVTFRLAFGTALLALVVALARVPLPRDPRLLGHLVLLAVVNIVVPFSLITWAERSIDSGLASILNATTPFFTLLLGTLGLHDERMTGVKLMGLGVGFGGVVVISSRSLGGPGTIAELGGIAGVVLASLAYAYGNVHHRRYVRGTMPPTAIALGQVGLALPIVAVLGMIAEGGIRLPAVPAAWLAVAWLGVVGSGIAYLLFFRLLAVWGPTRVSLVTYLMQVVAVALGVIVLGETLDLRFVAGAVLVIGGITLVNLRSLPTRRTVPEP